MAMSNLLLGLFMIPGKPDSSGRSIEPDLRFIAGSLRARHRRRVICINASRKAHIVTKPLILTTAPPGGVRSTRASELLTALKEGHLMASLQTEVESGAPGSAIWTTRSVGVEKIVRFAISCSITINVVASMGIF